MEPRIFPIVPSSNATFVIMQILAAVMLFFTLVTLFITFNLKNIRAEISHQGLAVRGDLYGKLIPLPSLNREEAKLINLKDTPDLQPKLRTNGIGLPGYASGWFRLRNNRKALLFLTRSADVVYIPTDKGYVILMSPEYPQDFLRTLKEMR